MELRGKAIPSEHVIDVHTSALAGYRRRKDNPVAPAPRPDDIGLPGPGDSGVYVGSGDPDRPARRISEHRLFAGLVVTTILGLAGGMVVGILTSPATWGRC